MTDHGLAMETTSTEAADGRGWVDHLGFQGPLKPGTGGRRDPKGEFPTGPEVGTVLPDIVAIDDAGRTVDVHRDRAGGPAVVLFYRSAVW